MVRINDFLGAAREEIASDLRETIKALCQISQDIGDFKYSIETIRDVDFLQSTEKRLQERLDEIVYFSEDDDDCRYCKLIQRLCGCLPSVEIPYHGTFIRLPNGLILSIYEYIYRPVFHKEEEAIEQIRYAKEDYEKMRTEEYLSHCCELEENSID
ncbi:MAG: hypothetical protein NTY33_03395 [Candidatus Moranbacteria bacterium]|nr:hypothetical protein [Candidatus Moranbacteria bacterium]